MDWNDPAERLRLAERLGPAAYNAAVEKHHRDSTVDTVNGYGIRPVMTRFGRLFHIDGLNVAFRTLDEAKRTAAEAEGRSVATLPSTPAVSEEKP